MRPTFQDSFQLGNSYYMQMIWQAAYHMYQKIFRSKKDFTKSKISELIIERDNYKNRLEEVQEAFRWTEMLRATKYDQLNRGIGR